MNNLTPFSQVGPDLKLTVLYLMDSILKNHSDPYKKLFAGNVVTTFAHVFKHSNEKGRTALFKLRNTWNDVFAPQVLFDLDKAVKKMDPAWPIAKPKAPLGQPTNIHINPAVFGRHTKVSGFPFCSNFEPITTVAWNSWGPLLEALICT
jgi:pre-mRNA cleavage complex 2 protein Pcf11